MITTKRILSLITVACGLFITSALCFYGCSHPTATSSPPTTLIDTITTPAWALDPPLDSVDPAFLQMLLDSASHDFTYSLAPPEKGKNEIMAEPSIASLLADGQLLVEGANGEYGSYRWGGKQIKTAQDWSIWEDEATGPGPCPPMGHNNDGCGKTIGLDCSGFIQYLFKNAGYGIHSGPGNGELNAQGLSGPSNWEFLGPLGLEMDPVPTIVSVADLQAGDILFFGPTLNSIDHIGIFLSQNTSITHTNGKVQLEPAFLNAVCHAQCERCACQVINGAHGIVVEPMTNFLPRLVEVLRIKPKVLALSNTESIKLWGAVSGSWTDGLVKGIPDPSNPGFTIGIQAGSLVFTTDGDNASYTAFGFGTLSWTIDSAFFQKVGTYNCDAAGIVASGEYSNGNYIWGTDLNIAGPPYSNGTITISEWSKDPNGSGYVRVSGSFSFYMVGKGAYGGQPPSPISISGTFTFYEY